MASLAVQFDGFGQSLSEQTKRQTRECCQPPTLTTSDLAFGDSKGKGGVKEQTYRQRGFPQLEGLTS